MERINKLDCQKINNESEEIKKLFNGLGVVILCMNFLIGLPAEWKDHSRMVRFI
jgi:hypothetical protein